MDDRWSRLESLTRGKSGLHRAAQGVTPLQLKIFERRLSAEEQWNRENVQGRDLESGKGAFEGAAGVKTAKLCAEQDQIGEQLGIC